MRQLSPDDLNSEFDRNYEYYRQRMERSLVKRVYDRGRFDDICQDTFVKALTYYASHRDKLPQTEYHLGNVLGDMAVQVAIDDYRKNKSKDYLLLSEIEDTHLSELMVTEGLESQISDFDRFQKVITQFPPKQQGIVLAIVTAMFQGFKQKDIADELSVSPSTVSEYVKLIRAELRKYYPAAVPLYTIQQIEGLVKRILPGFRGIFSDHSQDNEPWFDSRDTAEDEWKPNLKMFDRRYIKKEITIRNDFGNSFLEMRRSPFEAMAYSGDNNIAAIFIARSSGLVIVCKVPNHGK